MTQQSRPESAIPRVELRDSVWAELRRLILAGHFPPGQRLIETDLAARFGTSRGPVRDALAALERTGLVRVEARGGAFVQCLSAADVEELYSLRLALEELAVRRMIERVKPADLAEMHAALESLAAAMMANDHGAAGAADMRFHRTIVAAAHHRRLRVAWESLADQTLLLLRELPGLRPDIQADPGQHRALLDAITDRNEVHAVETLRHHLDAARDAVLADRASAPQPQ